MKVKDLIKSLNYLDPESEIVLRPLYQNPMQPKYVMKKIRTYNQGDRVIIDGYEKEITYED
jgi:hypothetical protein